VGRATPIAIVIEGGCLCGAVRYRVAVEPAQTTLCHCEDCRRASGAPAMAWTFFRSGSLEWTRGRPGRIEFAERERAFCRDCGTPLTFFDPSIPEWFEVSTGSLDRPEEQVPVDQCWVVDELPWFAGMPGLPRYEHAAPLPDKL